MFKTSLRVTKMSTPLVHEAQTWAKALIVAETRGSGDRDNAMRRIERRDGVPYGVLWALTYRPPRDVPGSALVSLFAAYEAMCERQVQKYENALAINKAKGRSGSVLARLAAAVAGQPVSSQEE